ncbi:MAG: 5-(carboxyamino)imidazole ribonucleotide synthase [Rhodospirillales bacterium]|nr:5-(carboxyamino)imidazole ribonucleotide synthase [Rhodospirillales bacterium]
MNLFSARPLGATAARPSAPLAPGSTIGIMGGGQLGRMTALAAARLGYTCHIFTDERGSPASQVAAAATVASYADQAALAAFADAVHAVTFEFENVPHESVRFLTERIPVRPGWDCLRIAQDRLVEKEFINRLGIPTTAYASVEREGALAAAVQAIGRPAVLKTARMGYDGKGQVLIAENTPLDAAWREMGNSHAILEGFVDLAMEISVIVARGLDGKWVAYPPVENRHRNHILDVTRAPAAISDALARDAIALSAKLADAMGLVGLLAVEMFVARDGRLLVNEIAPRPHNSGHWTIDACVTSQFEQFVRAVAGLPLGSVDRHADAVMQNLIGTDVEQWPALVAEPGAKVHLYGKNEIRPGRKMGHVTRLYPKGSLTKE